MSSELEVRSPKKNSPQRKLRSEIPEEHRLTDDARLEWLWSQRLIVVHSIYNRTTNVRDKMAAALVLGAAWQANLASIELLLKRLEGGAVPDQEVQEDDSLQL